jgi:hypothetical protein
MPERLQRRRTRGWKKPEGAVCVSRPGLFGNPFSTVSDYRDWLRTGTVCMETLLDPKQSLATMERRRAAVLEELPALRGKDLLCWCPPGKPCHAAVLLELANP